ncbi:DUF6884 domain-containing protein [Pyxidicoccus sp. MSG2]|uniref:DUF6884 domain-containing protein n=1 Tax=Pyxidicoccus sp. MSG2 TaxID=2996790 RepID=UPI00227039FB|nr:DUF6884 domain-containing protein [Pyxidicoccus sp. MSG2]MCY1023960.1 hypothetical protein [Pyxidicoccus sp. MSG2]
MLFLRGSPRPAASQLTLDVTVPVLQRCALCRSRGINPACSRCELRRRRDAPLSAEQLAQRQASSLAAGAEAAAAQSVRRQRLERLAALGRPVRLALVGCGKNKHQDATPARELYTGALFRAAYRYSTEVFHADEVLILSALHEVVTPDTLLTPYERTLHGLPRRERDAWAFRCASKLEGLFLGLRVEVLFLAGADYALPWHMLGWTPLSPLKGISGIGKQLGRLNSAPRPQAGGVL